MHIFVNTATGYIDVQFQSFFSAHATIDAVEQFKADAKDNGIIILEYQSDGGSCFTSNKFQKHLASKGQTNCYSGASTHHQNRHAEHAIQTIMGMAQTMMIYLAIHWSQIADAMLWPMCVNHAVWIYNHVPNMKTGISPNDLWSKTKFPLN